MSHQLKVMISSTARDLPLHREEVRDACLLQGMFPTMMEYLPASDDEAISASLKLIDEADIYMGIFAHRYGYVPKKRNRKKVSITEMEYNHAFKRRIPRLIFIIHEDHSIKKADVEMGDGAIKLEAFKERLLVDNIVESFKSPDDLRARAINGLSEIRRKFAIPSYTNDLNIFVAHSSHDWNSFVDPLVQRLRNEGLAVWASEHLRKQAQIKSALEVCDLMVLCITPHALNSSCVKMGYNYFIKREKSIFRLVCQDTEQPNRLNHFPSVPFIQMDELIKQIKQLKLFRIQSLLAKYEP